MHTQEANQEKVNILGLWTLSHTIQGSCKNIKKLSCHVFGVRCEFNYNYIRSYYLTKYVVGANPNPPKNPRSALKKGNVMAIKVVKAEKKKQYKSHHM